MEPSMPNEKVFKLFKQCTSQVVEDDALKIEMLANQILTYKIGGWGREFFSSWLEKRKEKYLTLKKNKKK